MVDELYNMKNAILQEAKKELEERGIRRIDINRMGELIDMVKDLAEAEEKCWKAEYYRTVTQSMKGQDVRSYGENSLGRSGYTMEEHEAYPVGGDTNKPVQNDGMDLVDKLSDAYRHMDQDERMRMKNQILVTLGSM